MNRTAYIFVPGVLNYPGSSDSWTDKAVTWIHVRNTCEVAEKFEYAALPVSRKLLADRRAKQLAALMDKYPLDGFSLVLAGHSNGCDVIRRAVLLAKRPANFVHFFSPAVPVKPESHGLIRLIRDGRIGFLNIHLAGRDGALGHNLLGGARADAVREQFKDEHHAAIQSEPGFGHLTWWKMYHFEATMKSIAGPFGGNP